MWVELVKWKCLQIDVSKDSQNGEIWYPTICWWPTTSGEHGSQEQCQGQVVSMSFGQTYRWQQSHLSTTGAKVSHQGFKPTVKLTAMKILRCAVYCTFKRACPNGPVKSQAKPNLKCCLAELSISFLKHLTVTVRQACSMVKKRLINYVIHCCCTAGQISTEPT